MVQAHGIQSATWLLVALPALSAALLLIIGKLGRNTADRWGPKLGAAVPIMLFLLTIWIFFSVKGQSNRSVHLHMFSWIPVGELRVDVGLLIDPLSLTFALLITGVGSLIHIYAVGYGHDQDGAGSSAAPTCSSRRAAIVLGDGYLPLYVGWEGVGVAIRLIGYTPTRLAATAAKKLYRKPCW